VSVIAEHLKQNHSVFTNCSKDHQCKNLS